MENKIFLKAKIKLQNETSELKEKASKVIDLPKSNDKQPDLAYMSAILVSSGENLNHAYFLGSELVAAEGTIANKALDVEHEEHEIIGHLYDRAFITKEGTPININEFSTFETANQDSQDMHIVMAGIIYKSRFPNLAEEIANGDWAVSMECYYQDYDIKIGDLILDRIEADALGLASKDDSILGRTAKVIKAGKEIAEGHVARVLRGICFSGCGIVKNPANPASVIIETANKNKEDEKVGNPIILNYDDLEDNNVTSDSVDTNINNKTEATEGVRNDDVGICVNYKRRLLDKHDNIIESDWCSAYETPCTSFSRDTTDENCLRNQEIRRLAKAALEELLEKRAAEDKRKELLEGLKAALREAVKTQSR